MNAWTIAWHPAVRHDVRAMNRRSAKEVCSAVQRLVERGEGRVETLGGGRFALRVDGAVTFMEVEPQTRSLRVLRVLATW